MGLDIVSRANKDNKHYNFTGEENHGDTGRLLKGGALISRQW